MNAGITTINLCAGPGGWEAGAAILGLAEEIHGYEINADACATARAAGFVRVQADIERLDPADFPDTTGVIISSPCGTFTAGGLRSGLGHDYQRVLDAITHAGAVYGAWDEEAEDGIAPGCGCTWEQVYRDLDDVADPRTRLVAQCIRFALHLPSVEWIALEQVPALEYAWEDIAAELFSAGWESADVLVLDAAAYGAGARRRRAFLVARRYEPLTVSALPRRPLPQVTMAQALGWLAGERVNTRGNRRTSGGNCFSADAASWCLTGKARGWYRERDGLRLTPGEAGLLQGFAADYPWHGSRTAQFQQIGDVVSPVAAAVILGLATGVAWEEPVRERLARIYPPHGAATLASAPALPAAQSTTSVAA